MHIMHAQWIFMGLAESLASKVAQAAYQPRPRAAPGPRGQASEQLGKACAARSVGTLLDLAFDLAIHEHTLLMLSTR